MAKATRWGNTLGFSDRLVKQLTGCSIDQIPKSDLTKGTALKTLMISRGANSDYYLVIAGGSSLSSSDKPTGNPEDYEIIEVKQ